MKFRNLIFSVCAALAMIAACEDNQLDEVAFQEDERDTYESEGNAENLFETLEAITSAGVDYLQNEGGRIAANKELEGAEITLKLVLVSAKIKMCKSVRSVGLRRHRPV